MLSVIMLSVIMLRVILPNVYTLVFVMLSIMSRFLSHNLQIFQQCNFYRVFKFFQITLAASFVDVLIVLRPLQVCKEFAEYFKTIEIVVNLEWECRYAQY